MSDINLSKEDIEVIGTSTYGLRNISQSSSIIIKNITRSNIENGYKYTITVTTGNQLGSATLSIDNKIKDKVNNYVTNINSSSILYSNDGEAPTITLGLNSDDTLLGNREVEIIIEDLNTGIAKGSTIKYGWSTSNEEEPDSYTTVVVTDHDGENSITVKAVGTNLSGNYYLWVKAENLQDLIDNISNETVVSSGTFLFDNSPTSEPTISFESNYLNSNLIMHYDGRNNTGNGYSSNATSWVDLSGNNRNGTLTGGIWNSLGLSFDGNDDNVYIGNQLKDLFKNNNTVEINVRFDVLSARDVLFGNYDVSNNINYEKTTTNGVRTYVNAGKYDNNIASMYTSTTEVYTTTFVWDKINGKILLYINGILKNTFTSAEISNYNYEYPAAYIGRDNRTGATALDGTIYEVRVYDDILTAEEIKNNYYMDVMNLGGYINKDVIVTITGGSANSGILKYQYSITLL